MFIKNHEQIQELISQIKVAASDAAILVEGKNDKIALRKLGIESKIFLLNENNNKSLVEVSENIAQTFRKVLLMMDLDPKGKELTKKMRNHIQNQGIKCNTSLGSTLLRVAQSNTVEGLFKIHQFD